MTEVFEPPTIYCANHPNVDTNLRCNRCEKPICTRCAVLTPTGYRCKECVRGLQKTYDTARWIDYPLTVVLAAGLGYVGSLVAARLGFFTVFIAPIAGVIIAEAIRAVVRKRRSKLLFQIAAAATAIGSLALLVLNLVVMLSFLGSGGMGGGLFSLLWQGLYAFLVTSTVYYRLSGIQMRY